MKLVTFKTEGKVRSGWIAADGGIVDMAKASGGELPDTISAFIEDNEKYMPILKKKYQDAKADYALEDVELLCPLPMPASFRDFMSFKEHTEHSAQLFNMKVPEYYYKKPVFYFSNSKSFVGPEAEVKRPDGCQRMDYECELAAIIGKSGKDISAESADDYIFGYSVLNDWSARDLQAPEIGCGLGPAKGKDFATSMGPCIVTKDEFEQYRTADGRFDVPMTVHINGKKITDGNYKTVLHTFPAIIEHVSKNVTIYPNEVLGSGTVGNGCLLELGVTDPNHFWLEPGDEVVMEIGGIGVLRNKII